MIKAIVILYAWFFVFLFSIYLDGMVQQQYGVAKNPECVQRCLGLCRKKKEKDELMEELESYSNRENNQIQMSDM